MTRMKSRSIALVATLALASALAACSSNDAGPAQRAGQKVDEGLHKLGEKMEEGGEKMQDKFE